MLAKALHGATAADKLYIESVFQTWLYTGNGSTQTITNGIDLSGNGGLVWLKSRTAINSGGWHQLFDTARGGNNSLATNSTSSQFDLGGYPTRGVSFSSTGFSVADTFHVNSSSDNIVSWTFRKAAKFFDVVTWTGNGTVRQISHSLNSVPGCIIVKRTDTAGFNWIVYHRSLGSSKYLTLETTDAEASSSSIWNATDPTSSNFTVGNTTSTNVSGGTYVAYLFAHDAGGFGDSGNDSVVKCGSFTGTGVVQDIDLGWEPQWVLFKRTDTTGIWFLLDTMRGWVNPENNSYLQAQASNAETTGWANGGYPTSTGWRISQTNGAQFIYIAIRRGPMKTPTDATKVFTSVTNQNNSTNGVVTTGFPVDMHISIPSKDQNGDNHTVEDRLRGLGNSNSVGQSPNLKVDLTSAEVTNQNPWFYSAWNTTIVRGSNGTGTSPISWFFRRAPGFFDVVAYTGDGGTSKSISHNLRVIPQFIIVKRRNSTGEWACSFNDLIAKLNGSDSFSSSDSVPGIPGYNGYPLTPYGASTSVFSVYAGAGGVANVNSAGSTYVAYLFATCPGVSKVGSYTASGGSNPISVDCGFTNGARFVLIKRVDTTGNWYVWDAARGIVSGNDPYLLLNSTAAEVANEDYIDPYPAGFEISSSAPAALRGNVFTTGTFIYLAIA